MNDVQEIINLFHSLMMKMQNREKKPNDFGTGEFLYRFEIHVIDAIYRNPRINVSDLSKKLLVTKGAISQVIYKLAQKGYITKEKDPKSNKIIYLILSPKGIFVAEKHNEFHKKMINEMLKSISNDKKLSYDTLLSFLKTLDSKL